MSRWERSIIAAVCIACAYAALIGTLVGIRALEIRSQHKARERS